MRRVLDPALWLKSGDCLPQIGGPAAQLGYMAKFEWNGADYESHSPCSDVPVSWASRRQLAVEFRKDWIRAHEGKKQKDEPCDPYWEASTTGNRSPSGSSSSSDASRQSHSLWHQRRVRRWHQQRLLREQNLGFVNSVPDWQGLRSRMVIVVPRHSLLFL